MPQIREQRLLANSDRSLCLTVHNPTIEDLSRLLRARKVAEGRPDGSPLDRGLLLRL